jgi:hypothetical protein
MKKEVEVTLKAKPAVPARKKVKEVVYCDICSDEIQPYTYGYGKRGSECTVCGRDMCRDCSKYDPDELGDYPDRYCTFCFSLFIPARAKMNERHWKEEEKLEAKIKKESLALYMIGTPNSYQGAKGLKVLKSAHHGKDKT